MATESLINQYSKEELEVIIKNSSSISEALRKIGYQYTQGTTYDLFKKICEQKNIDYSHFTGQRKGTIVRTEENVFCENSTAAQATLRSWYLKGKYSEYKCAICGISNWNGKELTLRLDHINGNNKDDRLENLRWVCPNCDSQLETFCKGHKRQLKKIWYCPECGNPISPGAQLCVECSAKKKQKVDRPDRETFKKMIRTMPFTHIAAEFHVSDKAISKWCIAMNLPSRKKEINSISDEQWELL